MSVSAIALMVLATSCAKNEVVPEGPGNENLKTDLISFRSSTGKTRANDNGLTQVASGFNVIGVTSTGLYINGFGDPSGNEQVYWKNGAEWSWKVTPADDKKNWPTAKDDYPLDFFAAFPKRDDIKRGVTSADITATPNMTPNAGFIYNTYFEKVANTVTNDVTVDYLAASFKAQSKPTNGILDLSFKHIMSNITFAVKVPENVTAVIHSIKVVNVNKNGRSYDYKDLAWSADEIYDDAVNHTHYAHYVASDAAGARKITKTTPVVNGFSDGNTGYNTLKLMPQTNVEPWALGVDATSFDSFRGDAAHWATKYPTVDAAAIEAWHMKETVDAEVGMKNSNGWKGARIEVIYCLVDTKNDKNLIGYYNGVAGKTSTRYIRVGYPLDIANIDTKGDGTLMGLQPGYRYTFTISLGTNDATNGVLLDPDYKDENGNTTTDPVDNPKRNPGDIIAETGKINFNVTVTDWIDFGEEIK